MSSSAVRHGRYSSGPRGSKSAGCVFQTPFSKCIVRIVHDSVKALVSETEAGRFCRLHNLQLYLAFPFRSPRACGRHATLQPLQVLDPLARPISPCCSTARPHNPNIPVRPRREAVALLTKGHAFTYRPSDSPIQPFHSLPEPVFTVHRHHHRIPPGPFRFSSFSVYLGGEGGGTQGTPFANLISCEEQPTEPESCVQRPLMCAHY